LEHVAFPASGFVTVTFPPPRVAPVDTVTFAVSCVDDTKLVEFTVIPEAENVAEAPLMNPVPVRVMAWFVAPRPLDEGLADVTTGAGSTVKHPVHVPTPASGLVTTTSPAPVVAVGEMVTLAVSWVDDTKVVELTVTPVAENEADAPETKPLPLIVMLWFAALRPRELGAADVSVGLAVTVKQPAHVPTPASPLLTVIVLAFAVAPVAIVMFAVTCVAETNVVEFTVMPVPEKDAARLPPLTNPDPFTATV
jgi:hypothetical protein